MTEAELKDLKPGKALPDLPAAESPGGKRDGAEPVKVYLSYAWQDDGADGPGREEVVDRLYDTLSQEWKERKNGIHARLFRDKQAMGFMDSIGRFIAELAQGDQIILVISDKYLKSLYCMAELTELYLRSGRNEDEFVGKVLVLVHPDAKLGDFEYREGILEYWKAKAKKLADLMDAHRDAASVKMAEDRDICRDAYQNCYNVMGILQNRLRQSPQTHIQTDFSDLKRVLQERIRGKLQA